MEQPDSRGCFPAKKFFLKTTFNISQHHDAALVSIVLVSQNFEHDNITVILSYVVSISCAKLDFTLLQSKQ